MSDIKHSATIKAHLGAPAVKRSLATFASQAKAGAPSVSYWVTFLLTVMLPMLPSLLLQAAPKIKTSTKIQAILKETRNVIDGLIGSD